ncbi:MAG: hypothetical protein DMG35_09420 [Acidobacteria bacterium]|nr:MAG: hypothetical protein DMG35_09420 [Acidobacteriota bacterium]
MRAIFMGFAVALFLSVSSTATDHLENDFKGLFLKHWQVSKDFTLAVAEAMPAESYSFKPNPQEMSFGEMMINLAQSNSDAFARVAGTKELTKPAGNDKQTAIKFLADSFDQCAKDFAITPPERFDKPFDIPEGRQATGLEVLWWAFTDTAHHRGQAEVYLRVKNITPPHYRF